MVVESFDATTSHRFELRPNRSLTWRQTQKFFALVASVTLAVALGFSFMGFWPVLPFAGLELAVLWVGFWLCAGSGRTTEVVSIRDSSVVVQKGRETVKTVWKSPRPWAQVRLQRSRVNWYPSRLVLRSHGREIALGEFLVEEERRDLARKLRTLLGDTGPG